MEKIKILFLAANPSGTGSLQLDEEHRAISQKIRQSEYRDNLELTSAWAVRPDDLLQALNEHRPNIVHFSGHGSTTGELICVDNAGNAKPISTNALKSLFDVLKDNIRLVVLNACYSKQQAEILKDVIGCVIGMNSAIGDQAAILFASSFYRAIAYGKSIDEAFRQGTVSLQLEGIPEEHTPELISSSMIDPSSICLITGKSLHEAKRNTTPAIDSHPASILSSAFREVIAARRYVSASSALNIVFGNLSEIQKCVVALPVNQSFDFNQRGPRSVLASFENIQVNGTAFYKAIERLWLPSQRQTNAGLGNCKYLRLPTNPNGLPGVMFVVTTRDQSSDKRHYGYYVDTPIEGIDFILDQLIEEAESNKLPAIALPLLGAGYANVGRTQFDPEKVSILQQIILVLTVRKMENHLSKNDSFLKRVIIVVFSKEPQGQYEHEICKCAAKVVGKDDKKKNDEIESMLSMLNSDTRRANQRIQADAAEPRR